MDEPFTISEYKIHPRPLIEVGKERTTRAECVPARLKRTWDKAHDSSHV